MTGDGERVPATTIAGIALASALVPLNSTMIAVALPEIGSDFGISTRQASVLVTIYIAPCLFCAVEEWKWKRATAAKTASKNPA